MLGIRKNSSPIIRCFLNFQKFMSCNEKSDVKLDEVNLFTKKIFTYPCYPEIETMFDICGGDLFELMWESYKLRIMSGQEKSPSYNRIRALPDYYNVTSDRKVLHY